MSALQSIDLLIEKIDDVLDDKVKKEGIPKSKHFIQSEETAVIDSIDGQLYHDDTITKLYGADKSIKVVIRSDWKTENKNQGDEQVAIVVGGGSGHFPSFWGFVGKSMCAASINGGIVCNINSIHSIQIISN